MKIAILTANYPPKICGVGDHSYHLANELRASGNEVLVFTNYFSKDSGVFPLKTFWHHGPDDFDYVLLQYTPYLYGRFYGLSPLLLLRLRQWKKKFLLLAHELYYPYEFSFAGVFVSPLHRLQFAIIRNLAKHTFFTYETPLSSRQEESWLPVGSNIPVTEHLEEGKNILHFGGAHPTHEYHLLSAAAMRMRETLGGDFRIRCIGVTAEDLKPYEPMDTLDCLGRLSPEEVSKEIHRSSLVLAPFMDGVSTRRGSFMAALAHKKPVITNLGASSNASVPWKDFCLVVEKNEKAFAESAIRLLNNPEEARGLGEKGFHFYQNHFSWKKIAEQISVRLSGF